MGLLAFRMPHIVKFEAKSLGPCALWHYYICDVRRSIHQRDGPVRCIYMRVAADLFACKHRRYESETY